MRLSDRYDVRIYIAPVSDPEMMFDDYDYYKEEHENEPFKTLYYIYDNQTEMAAVECDTCEGYFETVEEAIECYEYRIKVKESEG